MVRQGIQHWARTPTVAFSRRDILRPLTTRTRMSRGDDMADFKVGSYESDDCKVEVPCEDDSTVECGGNGHLLSLATRWEAVASSQSLAIVLYEYQEAYNGWQE